MSNAVKFYYTDYKRVKSKRKIIPIKLEYTSLRSSSEKSTEYHPEIQWLLVGFDIDKQDVRSFTVKDIHFPVYTHKCWKTYPISVDSVHYRDLDILLKILSKPFDMKKYRIKETIKIFKFKFFR